MTPQEQIRNEAIKLYPHNEYSQHAYIAGATREIWVKSSDRLPENLRDILLYKDGEITMGYYQLSYENFRCYNDDSIDYDASRWAELPAPPKE